MKFIEANNFMSRKIASIIFCKYMSHNLFLNDRNLLEKQSVLWALGNQPMFMKENLQYYTLSHDAIVSKFFRF